MIIEVFEIEIDITDYNLITDILKIYKKDFYFNRDLFDKENKNVMMLSSLTAWGIVFKYIIINKLHENYMILTSAFDRTEAFLNKFDSIESGKIIQEISNEQKIDYLNNLKEKTIYIDDNNYVINRINNHNVISILYPKPFINNNKNKIFISNKIKKW